MLLFSSQRVSKALRIVKALANKTKPTKATYRRTDECSYNDEDGLLCSETMTKWSEWSMRADDSCMLKSDLVNEMKA